MNRRFHKPVFFILILRRTQDTVLRPSSGQVVRPPQEECDIYPPEENSNSPSDEGDQKTASGKNFSESQISQEETPQPTEVKEENSPADEKPSQRALSYYKARYYHPTLGRFLQRDPLGYVDGYNLYAYVNNNPLNWIDPLGMNSIDNNQKVDAGQPGGQLKISVWKPSYGITDPNNPLNNEFVSYVDRGFNLEPKVSVEYDANGVPTRIIYDYRNTSSGPINTAAAFVAKPFADFARGVDQQTAASQLRQDGRYLEAYQYEYLGRQSQAQGTGTVALTLAGGAMAGRASSVAGSLGRGIEAVQPQASNLYYSTGAAMAASPVASGAVRFATEFGQGYSQFNLPQTTIEAAGTAASMISIIRREYDFKGFSRK